MVNEDVKTDRISELLTELPRVEAPGDFDFRVRARIAGGEKRPARRAWLAPATVAIPAGLIMAVGGYFAYTSYAPVDGGPASVAVSVQPAREASAAVPEPIAMPPAEEPEVASERREVKPALSANRGGVRGTDAVTFTANGSQGPGFGTVDSGLTRSKRIYQKGLDPTVRSSVKPKDFENPGTILPKDILSAMGVEVVFSGSGWKVESVRQNSTAERAGMKAGDVVEAINDQKVDEKTSFRGKFTGKSLRLKRGDEKVEIDLRKP